MQANLIARAAQMYLFSLLEREQDGKKITDFPGPKQEIEDVLEALYVFLKDNGLNNESNPRMDTMRNIEAGLRSRRSPKE